MLSTRNSDSSDAVSWFRQRRDEENAVSADTDNTTRRDFLTLAGPAFFAVGGAVTLWPFIQQMNPDAGAVALA
ncbi:MAG: ubiquinol-cytochrome c reductase iron-sulfur subunit N-terminal domain-containing protein, partial [Pseudomonadota bacterium]